MKRPVVEGHAPALVAEGVVKRYPGQALPALDRLSLSIDKGALYGLLGPNGAGKTTAMSILTGLQFPDSGMVRVHGMNYRQHARAIKAQIGLVPQDLALYHRLTGLENLQYFARLLGLKGSRLKAQIEQSLELCQLHDRAKQPVALYSGGMKRRLNLAIGLLNEPEIVFLDEPTAGLDPALSDSFVDLISGLHDELHLTVVMVSHDLDTILDLSTQIIVLADKKVVASGLPEDILRVRHPFIENFFLGNRGRKVLAGLSHLNVAKVLGGSNGK